MLRARKKCDTSAAAFSDGCFKLMNLHAILCNLPGDSAGDLFGMVK